MRNTYLVMTVILFCSFCGIEAKAQVGKFQALYLINFTKNLDWPGENVTIGVVGNTKALTDLEPLADKYANIRLKKISGSESVGTCQMVFLPSSQNRKILEIQGKLNGSSTVLVVEDRDLVSKGAEIGFFLEGNKLKFLLNKKALDEAGVEVNDKLLSVAAEVVN